MNTAPQERLEMRWLPVREESGRTRMEAVWVTVSAQADRIAAVATHAA